jgi:hypothetical protein
MLQQSIQELRGQTKTAHAGLQNHYHRSATLAQPGAH